MIDDLKNYVADESEDQFQLIASDAAGTILLVIGALIGLFWPYL